MNNCVPVLVNSSLSLSVPSLHSFDPTFELSPFQATSWWWQPVNHIVFFRLRGLSDVVSASSEIPTLMAAELRQTSSAHDCTPRPHCLFDIPSSFGRRSIWRAEDFHLDSSSSFRSTGGTVPIGGTSAATQECSVPAARYFNSSLASLVAETLTP